MPKCLNTKTQKQRLALHQSPNSFPHRKTKRQSCLFDTQHALCCVALVPALPSCQWQRKTKINSHPFTLKLLSISIEVNAYKLLTNSKNILLLHEVVVKPMVKNIMHIQENEVVP
jgi:hypothetical protein